MTIPELRQVAAWLADTDIGLFELRSAHGHIRLRRSPGGAGFVDDAASAVVVAASSTVSAVAAPSVGLFLHRHPLRATPLAPTGTTVLAGQVVGLLQIGALLLKVVAPQAGVVADILVAHGSLVSYGTTLLELHPSLALSSKL
ncbi:MAG: biotin/lipoyl-containing protein [Rhodoferax sp.]